MSSLQILLAPLHPIVTGPLLFVASKHPERLEEILSKYLPAAVTTAALKKCLRVVFALGMLRKVNNLLSEYALGNWSNKGWKLGQEVVLITGASNGIGELLVHRLAKSSKVVIVLDISPSKRPLPSNAVYYNADVTKSDQIANVMSKIRGTYGAPTVLINNAGVAMMKTILDETEAQIVKTFEVNIISHFILVKEVLPAMIEHNHGHIVTLASLASYVAIAQNVDYSCTKAATLAFHEGLAAEIRARYRAPGIRTTAVHPSWIRTPMIENKIATSKNFNAKVLEPDHVVDAIAHHLLSGKSGQLYLPGRLTTITGFRGYPIWFQHILRYSADQLLA